MVSWFIAPLLLLSISICDAKVLVLGSGGVIGSALLQWLHANQYQTLEVTNRTHIDLRVPTALDVFSSEKIDFVFFLACEVGGSKYIDSHSGNVQLDIIQNNIQMYQTVFPWLAKRRIPFVFTSSYLQSQATSYGSIKRLGEGWIKAIGFGKSVRLWNIYGVEKPGIKSHVLTDWVTSCLLDGRIECRTDGTEARQFLHASDCAAALGTLMREYDGSLRALDLVDLSFDKWTTLQNVARLVSQLSPRKCDATFSSVKAVARARFAPDTSSALYQLWQPQIGFEEGVTGLFAHFQRAFRDQSSNKRDMKET